MLELVAKRARALADARAAYVILRDGGSLEVAEVAGEVNGDVVGTPLESPILEQVAGLAVARRFSGPAVAEMRGIAESVEEAILAPLNAHGADLGVLLFDRFGSEPFTIDDELALESLATSAAGAIAASMARQDERVRLSIESAERERSRWARELHDETLQELAALSLMQQAPLEDGDPEDWKDALARGTEQLAGVIEGLQGLITAIASLRRAQPAQQRLRMPLVRP